MINNQLHKEKYLDEYHNKCPDTDDIEVLKAYLIERLEYLCKLRKQKAEKARKQEL